jgi:hypothetical protein
MEEYVLTMLYRVEVSTILSIFYILYKIERRVSFVLYYKYIIRRLEVDIYIPLIIII